MIPTPSKAAAITGWILFVFSGLFLLFDGATHLFQVKQATDAFAQLGYATNLAMPIGLVQLVCLALYLVPQTSVLGAILLTGYLGGAVSTNLRAGMPAFNVIFPIIIGVTLWGGLWLRDMKLRALFPLKTK